MYNHTNHCNCHRGNQYMSMMPMVMCIPMMCIPCCCSCCCDNKKKPETKPPLPNEDDENDCE